MSELALLKESLKTVSQRVRNANADHHEEECEEQLECLRELVHDTEAYLFFSDGPKDDQLRRLFIKSKELLVFHGVKFGWRS